MRAVTWSQVTAMTKTSWSTLRRAMLHKDFRLEPTIGDVE